MSVTSVAEVRAGSLADLQSDGKLLTKVGTLPVVVFWLDDRAYAIEDRCPHLGFPLHQGTVENGLVTCHWHHARFDLVSGCTLDLWADDARGFDAEIRDDDVFVRARRDNDVVGHLQTRLRQGLEESITLVIAKSVLGLFEVGVSAGEIVRTGVDFGTTYRCDRLGRGPDGARRDGESLPAPRRRRPFARARARPRVRRARHEQSRASLPRHTTRRSRPSRRPACALVSPLHRHSVVGRGRANVAKRRWPTRRGSPTSTR